MVALTDIVPQTRTVQTSAGALELRGLSLRQIATLLLQFPTLRGIITAGAQVDADSLLIAAPDAVAAIVAEAAGQPEAADRIADGALAISDLLECLAAIRDLTLGSAPGPFFERLRAITGTVGNGAVDGPYGGGLDTNAQPALSN